MLHENCDCSECVTHAMLDVVGVMTRFEDPAIAVRAVLLALGYATSIVVAGGTDKIRAWSKRVARPNVFLHSVLDGHDMRVKLNAALALMEARLSTQH